MMLCGQCYCPYDCSPGRICYYSFVNAPQVAISSVHYRNCNYPQTPLSATTINSATLDSFTFQSIQSDSSTITMTGTSSATSASSTQSNFLVESGSQVDTITLNGKSKLHCYVSSAPSTLECWDTATCSSSTVIVDSGAIAGQSCFKIAVVL